MTLELSQQKILALLIVSVLLGYAFGFVYDIIRMARITRASLSPAGKRKKKKLLSAVVVSLEDFLFFVTVGCATAILFYVYNYGRVRIFAFVTEALGFAAYRMTLSHLLLKLYRKVENRLARAFMSILRKVIMPPFRALKKRISARIGTVYTKHRIKQAVGNASRGYDFVIK